MTKTNLKKLSLVDKYIIGFKFLSTPDVEFNKAHKKYLNKLGKIIAYNEKENIFHVSYPTTYLQYPGDLVLISQYIINPSFIKYVEDLVIENTNTRRKLNIMEDAINNMNMYISKSLSKFE
jgi:hypothetical protein